MQFILIVARFHLTFFVKSNALAIKNKQNAGKANYVAYMYYKVGFFFCKVDKFLPHIFLGAYKMATKMTLTYVKMTCFFHENIFFSYLLKIKLSKHTLDYVLDASTLVLSNYVSVRAESCVLKLIFIHEVNIMGYFGRQIHSKYILMEIKVLYQNT